jgi:hypothetical protein
MRIRTSKDLAPALYGSAFRRVTCDGRTWFVRKIRTLRDLFRGERRNRSRGLSQFSRRKPRKWDCPLRPVRTGRNM